MRWRSDVVPQTAAQADMVRLDEFEVFLRVLGLHLCSQQG
jgi:hypothetical protein